jgi:hypothetical protein
MKVKILLATILILLTACSLLATPTPVDSGITGKVSVGPMCPVMIEGQDCPDRPLQATLTVNSSDGKKIVQFQTDAQGNFKVPLPPGDYVLHPETPQGKPLPFASDQPFIVSPGEFTQLNVQYDSGIR